MHFLSSAAGIHLVALRERCRDAPTLLVATQPAVGLSAAHVAELDAWAGALSAGAP